MATLVQDKKKEFITLTIMVLSTIAAWAVVPEFRSAVGSLLGSALSSKPSTQPPDKPAAGPVDEDKKIPAPPMYVGGLWQYDLNGKICLIEQQGDQLKFFIDDPEKGQVQIGSGVITQDRVKATILVRTKGRRVSLDLRLSENGEKLEGKYIGADPKEEATVSLSKQAQH